MNTVDYLITPSDEKRVVVRLRHKKWSKLLDRDFMATDLITTVPIDHEAEVRADLEAYCHAPEGVRADFLATMKVTNYSGRLLPDFYREAQEAGFGEEPLSDEPGEDAAVSSQGMLF